jgi:hypothetical protein
MVEYSARMGNNNAILNIFFAPYILAMIVIRFSFSIYDTRFEVVKNGMV